MISVKKLDSDADIERWWVEKRSYEANDIFANWEDSDAEKAEALVWFGSQDYYDTIMRLHRQAAEGGSPLQFVFFNDEEGEYLGFADYKIYTEEDGKAIILDFSVSAPFRNKGLGERMYQALEETLYRDGATYVTLNTSNADNRRFWQRIGFQQTKPNEYGEMVYRKEIIK